VNHERILERIRSFGGNDHPGVRTRDLTPGAVMKKRVVRTDDILPGRGRNPSSPANNPYVPLRNMKY